MARHKKIEREEEPMPELDISSLIDVCFLLLIYFIVTSTVTPREQDLVLALPSSTPSADQPKIAPLFIRVDPNGTIFIGTGSSQQALDGDSGVRDLPLLLAHLQTYASAARSASEKPVVQVYVDPGVTQQRVMDVLNAMAAQDVNITSVTFTDLVE